MPVNVKLHSMTESGLIDTWINKHVANSSNCDTHAKILSSHKRPLEQFTLAEIEQFFLTIIVGLITSVVGLLAEMIKAKFDRNNLKKISNIKGSKESVNDFLEGMVLTVQN